MAKRAKRASTGKPRATKVRASSSAAAPKLPRKVYANVSPRSIGGVSMFDVDRPITHEIVANFASEDYVIARTVRLLQEAGFEVLQATEMTINIAGSPKTYSHAFGADLIAEERPTIKEQGREDMATFIDFPRTDRPGLIDTKGTAFEELVEGVAIEEPYYLMAPSIFPPPKSYWHLDVPGDVSLACNADKAHRAGTTGLGIRVAMVDTGWGSHPYFTNRGYRVKPVTLGPATANPTQDESGHGTGESSNIFAIAPDVELFPVKALLAGTNNTVLVNTKGAFDLAVGLNPHIITNSWGLSFLNGPLSAAAQALAASVAAAVTSGIIVCFAAGNGHFGFPGQHPDVISVGGVFMDQDGSMRASNYSSGFMSNIYPGRRVPDLSGLVGELPGAIYIMLPLPASSAIDTDNAGGTHPNGDETASNDGWAAFSGTSAACPQIAGAAALIKQACGSLSPFKVRDILMKSARDVTSGTNAHGNTAIVGPDTATGNGLVDVHKAVMLAKLQCLSIVGPTPIGPTPIGPTPIGPTPIGPTPIGPTPIGPTPIGPTPIGPTPIGPTPIGPTPIGPTPIGPTPIGPTPIGPTPIGPTPIGPTPIRPIGPITPVRPIIPIRPIQPIGPGPLESAAAHSAAMQQQAAAQAAQAAAPQRRPGLTAEEVESLEQMVLDSEIDLG